MKQIIFTKDVAFQAQHGMQNIDWIFHKGDREVYSICISKSEAMLGGNTRYIPHGQICRCISLCRLPQEIITKITPHEIPPCIVSECLCYMSLWHTCFVLSAHLYVQLSIYLSTHLSITSPLAWFQKKTLGPISTKFHRHTRGEGLTKWLDFGGCDLDIFDRNTSPLSILKWLGLGRCDLTF